MALATATSIDDPDVDDAPLRAALAARGLRAATWAWDDATIDWAAARVCVLRSTWNYYRQPQSFLSWVDRCAAATRLWNPAPLVRWNSHKSYLLALAAQGVAVVPTLLVPAGGTIPFAALASRWPRMVIKPAISAGSYQTWRIDGGAALAERAALERLVADHDLLVQPYVPSVEDYGERSLIWIDGALTHTVRKGARFAGDAEQITPVPETTAAERALAQAALAAAQTLGGAAPLYARVDMARDAAGQPCLMELELIEPSLFLHHGAGAAARFAAAIAARL